MENNTPQASAAAPLAGQNNSPIFIVGAPRSGTTLLQFRLRNHPRISLPTGESHFIVPLYVHQTEFGPLDKLENIKKILELMQTKSRTFIETDLHGMHFEIDALAQELLENHCDTLPKIITWIFTKNAHGEGKARWGDKTPYYIMHLPKILAWWPDAQIIHIIRDGRDVALSLMERKHDFFVYNHFTAAQEWCKYVETGRRLGRQLGKNQYLEIKYETLLAAPQETLKEICAFLGEEYTDALFKTEKPSDLGKTPLVHAPIKSDNCEKWREKMSPSQLRLFESVAQKTLIETGYPLATEPKSISLAEKFVHSMHNKITEHVWRKKLNKPKIKNFTIRRPPTKANGQ